MSTSNVSRVFVQKRIYLKSSVSGVIDLMCRVDMLAIVRVITALVIFTFHSVTATTYCTHCSSCGGATSITITPGTTSISSNAFQDCTALTNVTIPSSVTVIGSHAFSGCISLTSVTIPSSVTTLGDFAFSACYALPAVVLPSSVTVINNHAFYNCPSLVSVNIPDGLTTLTTGVFSYCTSLKAINIPSSVTSIGDEAFSNTPLTTVVIPASVTSIGWESFYKSSLTTVIIPTSVTTIGDSAFQSNYDLDCIAGNPTLTGVTVGTSAFEGCPLSGCPPSAQPSSQPSSEPTRPTAVPTLAPTLMPTVVPTVLPSFSFLPSVIPTVSPTDSPSRGPTVLPSAIPTCSPTVAQPSSHPTSQPSRPTALPSVAPTVVPLIPTAIPTHNFTARPTTRPTTEVPTVIPTAQPSGPTARPSIVPSNSPFHPPTSTPTVDDGIGADVDGSASGSSGDKSGSMGAVIGGVVAGVLFVIVVTVGYVYRSKFIGNKKKKSGSMIKVRPLDINAGGDVEVRAASEVERASDKRNNRVVPAVQSSQSQQPQQASRYPNWLTDFAKRFGVPETTLEGVMNRTVVKEDLPKLLQERLGPKLAAGSSVSFEVMATMLLEITDAFLTHNWGEGAKNHKKVAEVNRLLHDQGIVTWFDEERMTGDIKDKMQEGIDNSACVVVFITQEYMRKVGLPKDNCALEFKYACNVKMNTEIVPVTMESDCTDNRKWSGRVALELGGLLFIDMSTGVTPQKVEELSKHIISVIKERLRDLVWMWLDKLTKPAVSSSKNSKISQMKLYDWLCSISIASGNSEVLCALLMEAGISSVESLLEKYQDNPQFLFDFDGVQDDDIDDIVMSLESICGGL